MKKGLRKPNRSFTFIPQVSPPQLFLYSKIRSRYKSAELNYPIQTDNGKTRYADIAIFSDGLDKKHYRLVIEYDGFLAHRNRKKQDVERDLELLRVGWKTIRINKNNINDALKIISEEIEVS